MPTVAILMCTFNGAQFLAAQLESIENQTFSAWQLFVSDDGSTDETTTILMRYQEKLGASRMQIRSGPRRGFVANFLNLACDPFIKADYFAFADQDDIWESFKLERALAWLQTVPANLPALHCGRTRLIDKNGRSCGYSPLFRRKPGFRNALVQSIAGGNTMVFNEPARQLLIAGRSDARVPAHDWWIYLLTTAAGGVVRYDPIPTVLYRSHPENVIGSQSGWLNRIQRLKLLFEGRFRAWSNLNVTALEPLRERMTSDNRAIFDLFRESRQQRLLGRLIGFCHAGVYRQTVFGNLGLMIMVCTGKI
jgi:glycosyltransferase involved in cell wall biosynthesis